VSQQIHEEHAAGAAAGSGEEADPGGAAGRVDSALLRDRRSAEHDDVEGGEEGGRLRRRGAARDGDAHLGRSGAGVGARGEGRGGRWGAGGGAVGGGDHASGFISESVATLASAALQRVAVPKMKHLQKCIRG